MRLPPEVEAAWKWGGPSFGVAGLIFGGIAKAVDSQTRRLKSLQTIHSGHDVRQVAGKDEVVVATGNVWSNKPLTDTMSGEKAVASVVHEVEFYNQRGDPSIFPDTKQRVSNITRRVAPMYIRLSGEDLQLLPDGKLLANVVSHTVTRKGAQRSLKQALVDVALKDCYVTRVEEQEFLLHLDKEITAIGKVRGVGNKFEMIPESLSKKNLREQLRDCGVWGSSFKSAARFCGWATVVLVGSYAAYKFWQARKKRKREQAYLRQAAESRRARQVGGAAGRGGGPAPEGQAWKCIVCWNEGVEQAVFPACGHIAVCADCSDHLTQCPICRVKSTPRRVYFS